MKVCGFMHAGIYNAMEILVWGGGELPQLPP